jgi:hypothetical protein
MSWLYSRALVAEFSAGTCSAGEPSAPSSGSPTPQAYLSPDRMTAFSRPSRFGMTFAPLTAERGADVLTWFLAGFPVRTSALPAREQASTASDPACGHTWRELWAKYDPASCSWRTLQPSLLEDSAELSPTWPRSGMTAAGQCWALPMLGRRTSETDSGLSVPTPTVYDSTGKGNPRKDTNIEQGGRHGVSLHHFVAMWPTPVAGDTGLRKAPYAQGGTALSLAAQKWPTPDAHMGSGGRTSKCQPTGRRPSGAKQQTTLNNAVKWATPKARDWKAHGGNRHSMDLPGEVGGSLNPTWVEWLMGWPLGWTDLKPLATAKCPSAPQPHGACSQVAEAA